MPNVATVYDLGGAPLVEQSTGLMRVATPSPINLKNSIANPFIMYYNGTSWYAQNMNNHRNDFWLSSGKTMFDPCPAGWRVPDNDLLHYAAPEPGVVDGGRNFPGVGFFPLAGRRDPQIFATNIESYIYLGHILRYTGQNNVCSIWKVSPTTSEKSNTYPDTASSIRCVKIK